MINKLKFIKIIFLYSILALLFANICYGEDGHSELSKSINKITNGIKKGVSSELSKTIGHFSDSDDKESSIKKKPILNVISNANPIKIYRGNYVEVTYIIESPRSEAAISGILINVPTDFEDIAIVNMDHVDKSEFKKNPHQIFLTGKLDHKNPLKLMYTAKVPFDASLKTYNMSEQFKYEKKACTASAILEIQNNLPKELEFNIISNPNYIVSKKNTTTCFAESNIAFKYGIVDEERNGITFNISINDPQFWNRSLNAYSSNIEYGNIATGNYSINISARDNDGGEYVCQRTLIIKEETYKQDFADKFLPLIIIFLVLLLICLFGFKLNENICTKIFNHWPVVKYILISFLLFWIVAPEIFKNIFLLEINFLTFVIVIYFFLSIFAIGLIEINFSTSISTSKECSLPKKDFSRIIRECLTKCILTLSVIFCMTIAVLIVGFSLPFSFANTEIDTHYSYVFYYYSAVVQLFGTILSIVAMFTIWYMQDRNILKENKDQIIKRIKDFMFLYMSVILLSLCGLALERIPLLDVVGKMDTIASSSAVFIFETTMLLTAPAMAALFRLASWFMDSEEDLTKEDSNKFSNKSQKTRSVSVFNKCKK